MVTTTEKPETIVRESTETVSAPPLAQPAKRSGLRLAVASVVVGALAVGAGVYASIANDPAPETATVTNSQLGPAEIAELRAVEMAKTLEQQWVAKQTNAAKVLAEDRARIFSSSSGWRIR